MDAGHLDWYVVRATGFVAWGLVSASVLYGLAHSSRAVRRPRPAWMLDVHRFVAGLACLAVLAHVVALLFDQFVGFSVVDVIVPFATRYRPGALAWGIVAAELLAIVELSSLLMRSLSRRLWHSIHLMSFGVFAATTVHALTAGTDRSSPLVRAFAVAIVAATVALTVGRVVLRVRAPRASARALDARLAMTPTLAPRARPTLGPVDSAIEEVVRNGATRSRRVARHGHHRGGVSRGTPR